MNKTKRLENCSFCYPNDKYRILHSSENFYIMVSLGQISEGYLLLVSKEHIQSCANLPSEYHQEFIKLYNKILQILKNQYGNAIAFEHGRSGSCLTTKNSSEHCFHSHMHFVPLNGIISDSIFLEQKTEYDSIDLFLKDINNKIFPYLFVHDDMIRSYRVDRIIERQYLRKLVSSKFGTPNLWNWQEFPRHNVIDSTISKLKTAF
ncbi:HIT domain-containing protein [Winogradskyella haliclonae]|uniref:HIT domain-containing protein n=1 Tax=Winogradskyella haliclonae TaxID=2048558 RepID=A0ABQ2BYH8_9FLAO|nr:HIT domain-containing protein [Winogradskyella haliclonae]GGI57561.1 hypothetical protein GCM10011444_18700 [Winogradskyella haliclonae]